MKLLLLYWILLQISPILPHPVVLETKLGDIQGEEFFVFNNKIRSFKGVPFAEPVVENERFRIAKPKKRWNGVWNATQPAKACFQTRDNYNTSFWGSEMWNANTPISEDCLYLNIWAPSNAYNLTVMVWIYGGGFYAGSASLPMYDGKILASTQNVIVVNINYRLGPFGFLYLGDAEAPGNMGLLDQQLALHWIRENIVAFGGNPDKVTIFGQSAGAASIVAHLISSGSRSLFQRAILQSGSLENQWAINSPFRAKQKSIQLLESVGCNKTTRIRCVRCSLPRYSKMHNWVLRHSAAKLGSEDGFRHDHPEFCMLLLFERVNLRDQVVCRTELSMSCLRLVPAEEISRSTWNLSLTYLEFPFVIVSRDPSFFGDVDARVALQEGDFHKNVDIMIGMNKDEGNYWNIYNLPEYFDTEKPPELTKMQFESLIDRVLSIQPDIIRSAAKYIYSDPNCTDHGRPTRFFANQMNRMVGDYYFSCDSLRLAEKYSAKSSSKVFVYHFTQSSSGNPWPKWTGAMHGYEIEYVFGIPLMSKNYKRREQIFSRKMMQYWASFAKDGSPKLKFLKNSESWPKYKKENGFRWMQLRSGSNIRSMKPQKSTECQFWGHVKNSEYTAYLTQEYATSSSSSTTGFFLLIFCFLFRF